MIFVFKFRKSFSKFEFLFLKLLNLHQAIVRLPLGHYWGIIEPPPDYQPTSTRPPTDLHQTTTVHHWASIEPQSDHHQTIIEPQPSHCGAIVRSLLGHCWTMCLRTQRDGCIFYLMIQVYIIAYIYIYIQEKPYTLIVWMY